MAGPQPLPAAVPRAYPAIEISTSEGERWVDLVREGVDCVLRVLRYGALPDSDLVARSVTTLPRITCAAPVYLKRSGRPDTIEELARHRAVCLRSGFSCRMASAVCTRPGYPLRRICFGRLKVNLSTVFAGQLVGIREVEDQVWLVSFLDYDLDCIDAEKGRVEPAPDPFVPDRLLTICPA